MENYDVEIEQAILGLILLENVLIPPQDMLDQHDFYDPLHQKMYQAISKMNADGTKITPDSLYDELKDDEDMEMVGGTDYLKSLARAATLENVMSSFTTARTYAIFLRKYKDLRVGTTQNDP